VGRAKRISGTVSGAVSSAGTGSVILMLKAWYEGWRYTHRAQNLRENALGLGVLFLVFLPSLVVAVLIFILLEEQP